MSRIHEAIRKAALEQRYASPGTLTSVEEILTTSYAVTGKGPAGAKNGHGVDGGVDDGNILQRCETVDWRPDKRYMLFASETPDLPGREQFRALRTNLSMIAEQRELKVVGIASALSGEGKSFVSANLAHSLAIQREQRVLMVDCDLRRGTLAGLLGARPGPGLTEYLRGGNSLASVIQHGSGSGLYLIPSGERVQEPGEMITSSGLGQLLAQLRPLFDWIVIDTPPTIQFADAGVIADLCDGILLVFGAGMTPVQLAKRAARELKNHVLLGAVLNRGDEAKQNAKYYSYYDMTRR